MHAFCVPPSPTWYTSPVCSPENGLLYIAGNHTSIAYIPPIVNHQNDTTALQNNIQIIQTHNQFKSIVCDVNWTTTKWFITMNEQNCVAVWDLDAEQICRGHKAHTKMHGHIDRHYESDSPLGGTLCITKNRQILSIDRNAFVRYCLTSNTYSIFPDSFIKKRGYVTQLTTSPYNSDIVAIGYRSGLILLANYADNIVLQTLRGQDSEIVSLQWTLIELPPPLQPLQPLPSSSTKSVQPKQKPDTIQSTPEDRSAKLSTTSNLLTPSRTVLRATKKSDGRREPPKPIVDAGDMFDIHSFDYLEDEFGAIPSASRRNETTHGPSNDVDDDDDDNAKPVDHSESTTNNENFNFIEECQTLREQMRGGGRNNQSDSDDSQQRDAGDGGCDGGGDAKRIQITVNMADIQDMMKNRGPIADGSITLSDDNDSGNMASCEIDDISNRSTIGSSHNTVEIAELEDVIQNLNINDTAITASDSLNGIVYLASGAQESCIVIWNTEDGTIADRIQLKCHGRVKIPKPNCTIAWIRPNELIVNGPDGRLTAWTAQFQDNAKGPKFVATPVEYPDTAVINICSNIEYDLGPTILYTSSTHLNIIGHRFNDDSSEIFAKYSTLPIGMFALRVCPHDPNKIAIAGNNKRINILDLSTLKRDNVEIQALTSKIQGKVLTLAWHPSNENLLSFSTNEGRVGIFNINKSSNAPDLIKNFNGKDLYSLSYSIDETTKKCILYVSNGLKLMMFNENSTKSDEHQSLEFPTPISSVSACDKYIAVGFASGMLKILSNNQEKTEVFAEVLLKKYISEMSWSTVNRNKLAVSSSDTNIYILHDDGDGFKKIGELIGHQSNVTFVNWSSQSEDKLVSASFDHTVRVWNTQTMECIAWSEYANKMQCAAFLPTDENFIMCSGVSETMHIFEIQKRLTADFGTFENKKKKKSLSTEVQWATLYQNEASKLRSQEKKKLRKLEKKASDQAVELSDSLNASQLHSVGQHLKLNHTTILYLTSKELNKEPLNHLERLLKEDPNTNGCGGDDENVPEFLHGKLFGDRESVTQLLNDELKNHRHSKTESIGNLLIPQINFELKAKIIESIEQKRLTEQQVSLAPSISYEFWKNCCLAYANQCIDQGIILNAIPYLLVIQQTNEAIEKLCDTNFYREAWVIAKMTKEPEDNIFATISDKWIKHVEQTGNLEGAALISFLAGKQDVSHEILNKRKSKTPQMEEILNILSHKINN